MHGFAKAVLLEARVHECMRLGAWDFLVLASLETFIARLDVGCLLGREGGGLRGCRRRIRGFFCLCRDGENQSGYKKSGKNYTRSKFTPWRCHVMQQ